jgi:hypothetical protein
MKKSIKSIYIFIAGLLTSLFAILFFFGRKKQIIETPEPIIKNDAEFNKLEGKDEIVAFQRNEITKELEKQKYDIANTETVKETLTVKPVDAAKVKEHIVKKTRRPKKQK